MKNGRTPETQSTAADISTRKATTDENAAIEGAAEQRPDAIRARIARLTDKHVLGVAGMAFPKDYPPHLIPQVREQLAFAIEQSGEPTATREQAAAHAAGQAAMLHFAGAREVVADVVTCGVGDRIGWAGFARAASPEPRLLGRPGVRPYVNVVAFGVAYRLAALRAAERLRVLHPASGIGWDVLAQDACIDLGERLHRGPGEVRERGLALVDWAFDETRSMLLGLCTAMQGVAVINPATIKHLAAATNAAALDSRDSFAAWFTDPTWARAA
jgi:hypothetical protein